MTANVKIDATKPLGVSPMKFAKMKVPKEDEIGLEDYAGLIAGGRGMIRVPEASRLNRIGNRSGESG